MVIRKDQHFSYVHPSGYKAIQPYQVRLQMVSDLSDSRVGNGPHYKNKCGRCFMFPSVLFCLHQRAEKRLAVCATFAFKDELDLPGVIYQCEVWLIAFSYFLTTAPNLQISHEMLSIFEIQVFHFSLSRNPLHFL